MDETWMLSRTNAADSFIPLSILVINDNFIWKFSNVADFFRLSRPIRYNKWIEVFINTNFELSTPDKTVKVSDG